MTYEKPKVEEIMMNAEIGGYQGDFDPERPLVASPAAAKPEPKATPPAEPKAPPAES